MADYKREYTKEVEDKLKKISLTNEQQTKLEECLSKLNPYDNVRLIDVFEDMYKLFVNDVSTSDIAKIYNRSTRTIQMIFKKFGMERDKFKAQSIAVKKRDYHKIKESHKKTMLKRFTETELFGSQIEQYIRAEVSLYLSKKINAIDGDVIVGVNTLTAVGELDIPIIILYKGKTYKYGIEVDGAGFHNFNFELNQPKVDQAKENKLWDRGYKMFRLETKAYTTSDAKIKYVNEINDQLFWIYEEILSDFNLNPRQSIIIN